MLPWLPKPGAQSLAWLSEADELFFGGIAGAGKSDLLIGLGMTRHRKSLFLRRQATQLREITSRVTEVMRPGDHWRGVGYGGVLTTSEGRTIEFTGCDNEKDKQKFKGRAHDLKAWDEVVDFPESVYLFVNGWNRTVVPGQRCRIVAASNPPTTSEGDWVIRRWRAWLDASAGITAAPGELRWYTTIGDKEEELPNGDPVTHGGVTYTPRSRTFIPGKMLDILTATGYQNTLATLPEPLRSIYLKGDFSASKQDGRWQLIPARWVEQANTRWAERYANRGQLRAVGADPSRGGVDKAVVAPRYGAPRAEQGAVVGPLTRVPGKSIQEGKDMFPAIQLAGGFVAGVSTVVDGIGIGASFVDSAKLLSLPGVVPVIVSNATAWRDPASPTLRFRNVRAAMMWHVRCLLDPERGPPETRLALPPDPELKADLTAPVYAMTTGGVQVESKEEIHKRLGRSTDAGDAVTLSVWEVPTGGWAVSGR